jgi:hypothetical protein
LRLSNDVEGFPIRSVAVLGTAGKIFLAIMSRGLTLYAFDPQGKSSRIWSPPSRSDFPTWDPVRWVGLAATNKGVLVAWIDAIHQRDSRGSPILSLDPTDVRHVNNDLFLAFASHDASRSRNGFSPLRLTKQGSRADLVQVKEANNRFIVAWVARERVGESVESMGASPQIKWARLDPR